MLIKCYATVTKKYFFFNLVMTCLTNSLQCHMTVTRSCTLPTLLHHTLTMPTTLDSLMASTATFLTVVCYPIRYVIRLFIMCYVNWCVFVSDFYVWGGDDINDILSSGLRRRPTLPLTTYSLCATIVRGLPILTNSHGRLTKPYHILCSSC